MFWPDSSGSCGQSDMNERQDKIHRAISENTSVIKASEVSYGSVQIFRRIVRSPESCGISLGESDLKILRSYDKGEEGLNVLKSYKPRITSLLDSQNPDAVKIGQWISDSRAAEQEVYQKQIDSLLKKLSPEGEQEMRRSIQAIAQTCDVAVTDWAGVAAVDPDLVLAMARDFVERIDSIVPAPKRDEFVTIYEGSEITVQVK